MKKSMETQVTKDDKKKYVAALQSIKEIAPEIKKKEVDDMIKVVENLNEWTKGETNEPKKQGRCSPSWWIAFDY